jgi:ribosomal protein S12 methylthiotransferase
VHCADASRGLGRRIEVIVDETGADAALARSMGDAPEIDGKVFLPPDTAARSGDLLTVVVDDADAYDLWASPVSN